MLSIYLTANKSYGPKTSGQRRFTWKIVKVDVQEVLIEQWQFSFVLIVVKQQLIYHFGLSHACHFH
jgi:hypothetical protein